MGARSDDAMPRVAAVTVTYHSEAVLPAFLESVPAASSAPIAVVIVDNAPTATGTELAAAHGASYLGLPQNPGYGAAMNAGVASLPASVEWVLLSNPDVVLGPGVLDTLIATAASDERIGAVGPAVLDPDGTVYPSARAVPSIRTGIGHALFANLWVSNPWSAAYKRDRETGPRDAGWLSGSCLLVRRSAFEAVGGFDERYFMYFEDVDLGYRLGKHGFRNVYEPSTSIVHTGAHATGGESRRMIRAHHESARRFLSSKYPGPLLWPVRVVLTVGLAVRSRLATRGLAE